MQRKRHQRWKEQQKLKDENKKREEKKQKNLAELIKKTRHPTRVKTDEEIKMVSVVFFFICIHVFSSHEFLSQI